MLRPRPPCVLIIRPPSSVLRQPVSNLARIIAGTLMTRRLTFAGVLFLLSSSVAVAQPPGPASSPLRVVSSGPGEEVASIEEANEIRIVFSEPMVTLGRIPDRLRPSFFRIPPR